MPALELMRARMGAAVALDREWRRGSEWESWHADRRVVEGIRLYVAMAGELLSRDRVRTLLLRPSP